MLKKESLVRTCYAKNDLLNPYPRGGSATNGATLCSLYKGSRITLTGRAILLVMIILRSLKVRVGVCLLAFYASRYSSIGLENKQAGGTLQITRVTVNISNLIWLAFC